MDVTETIRRFTGFFTERGHQLLPGSTLIPPDGDPVLFTTSGMHPLTPYLLGRPHPGGRRLTGLQRCLRTTDLDEVGDDSHLTVFGMLGSWSLGDYEGPQSLRWGLDLLTGGFGLDPGLLHATVFGGDEQTGPDVSSERTWTELGLPVERTYGDDNWWSNGPVGPCGPDSEIFIWTGEGPPSGRPTTDERWMELWNHVTMRYYRGDDGRLEPLRQVSVDTGMGLERLLMVLQRVSCVYDCDLFWPWRSLLPEAWQRNEREFRILSDHLRSSVLVIGDGVRPSNTGRGYVLRRLIRRVLTILWRDDPSLSVSLGGLPGELIEHSLRLFGPDPGERDLVRPDLVSTVLADEERRFRGLLGRGRKVLSQFEPGRVLTERDLTYLHETHGLPPDLVTELLAGPSS
ncbi:MAG TPA: alanine--tRNA ligase-related protein [Streptosporangiaceae bacterium]